MIRETYRARSSKSPIAANYVGEYSVSDCCRRTNLCSHVKPRASCFTAPHTFHNLWKVFVDLHMLTEIIVSAEFLATPGIWAFVRYRRVMCQSAVTCICAYDARFSYV